MGGREGGVSASGSSTCGLAALGNLGTFLGGLKNASGADLAGRDGLLIGATTGGKEILKWRMAENSKS